MLYLSHPHRQQLKYAYDFDPNSKTAAAFVVQFVDSGARVLEIGAGAGSIARPLTEVMHAKVTALEIDPVSADYLETFCARVVQADLNHPDWTDHFKAEPAFDAVVMADVLEHLLDPLSTLRAAASLLKPDGAVIVSLPHAGHNSVLACLLSADFEYREWGLLDKTHLRFFGIKNMKQLVRDAGLKIVDARFVVKSPSKTEFKDKWARLPMMLRYGLRSNRYGNVYQVVFKAVGAFCAPAEMDLETVPIPTNPRGIAGWRRKSEKRAAKLMRRLSHT